MAQAERDEKVVAVTAAMPSGTGLDLFAKRFPDRCFDVGIAEQHGVTFAAGLAVQGFRPFAAIYSTFLQRAYDQIVHDVAIQSLPVRFAIDRAGLVGADGPTHAGSFDVTYLATLPGFIVMAASDETELVHMVATACAIDDRPSAFRYPRGEGLGLEFPELGTPLEIGKGRIVREGSSVAILNFGARMKECLLAAEKLSAYGLSTTIADARFAKPLDTDLVRRLALPVEVDFMTVSSYGNDTVSSRQVRIIQDLETVIKNRDVLIVEDIVDTGHTLSQVQKILLTRSPKSLSICTLLNKPSRREVDVDVDWVGFDIPDAFVIGYGIDYAQQGRNLPHIGVVKVVK